MMATDKTTILTFRIEPDRIQEEEETTPVVTIALGYVIVKCGIF